MQYRNFGKLDWKVSALGFGGMRLPTTDGDPRSANLDERESIRIIRHAIDRGVNYLDTAYFYHGGNSERVLGETLRDGYRKLVKLATKSPTWLLHTPEDFDIKLAEQLQRLQTDYIDCYMLHGLSQKTWRNIVLKFNLLERAEQARRDGRIRHIGFSFHDDFAAFQEILNGYDHWDFTQIQYNYMDIENQAGTAGLKLAAEKGLAVIVMEPLLGGRLTNPPAAIREIYERTPIKRSPADWAFQWIWDQPEVSVVLSGMSSLEQVEANLDSASRSRVHSFTAADHAVISELRSTYLERTPIPCTKCGYCMPCPNGVNIPRNLELYNDAHLHEDFPGSRYVYKVFFPKAEHADACNDCNTCEELCPQKIPISDWMPKIAAALR
jgi:predicted aldo/keto reductase-like oxidoreductase